MTGRRKSPVRPLNPSASEVLVAIAAHRLMTADQLWRLVLPHNSIDWVRKLLQELQKAGLAESMRPRSAGSFRNLPSVWYATEKGARVAFNSPSYRNVRPLVMTADELAVSAQDHTLAVNEASLRIVAAVEARGDNAMWVNEVGHKISDRPGTEQYSTADALIQFDELVSEADEDGEVLERVRTRRILLELDRGTKPYDRILQQMGRYLKFRRFKRPSDEGFAWEEFYPRVPSERGEGFPDQLWVFDCEFAQRRLERFAALMTDFQTSPALAGASGELFVLLTTMERLKELGPFHPETFYDPYLGSLVDLNGRPHARGVGGSVSGGGSPSVVPLDRRDVG